MDELYELKDNIKTMNHFQYLDFLMKRYDDDKEMTSSQMKMNNMFFIAGVIETLYLFGKIDQIEYTMYSKCIGL